MHVGIAGRNNESTDGLPRTLALDLDVFVEFNPAYVSSYRLVGYENERKKYFLDRKNSINAERVPEGYRVTAIYEITPAKDNYTSVDERVVYQKRTNKLLDNEELANVRLKYKTTRGIKKWEIKEIIDFRSKPLFHTDIPDYVRHAAAITQIGLLLIDSKYKSDSSFKNVLEILETIDADVYEASNLRALVSAIKN